MQGLSKMLLGIGIMNSLFTAAQIPLFEEFRQLPDSIAYRQLGQWPTPVHTLDNFAQFLGITNLFIKREDQCSKIFGGNKIRKLEFLLADVLKVNKRSVICYGGVASNNVTATSAFAKYLGLECIAFLMHQLPAANQKRNLMLNQYYGCNFFLCPYNRELTRDELHTFLHEHNLNEDPYVIPTGSSSKIGIIGWVNAVFELKKQIEQGLLPEPDFLYVSLGSMGTAAGILLGVKAAGLKTIVKPIQVTDPKKYTPEKLCAMIRQTNEYLHEADPSFVLFDWDVKDIQINTNFFGYEFACHTPEADAAQQLIWQLEGIIVDESYTAKVIAGLIHDAHSGFIKPTDTVLYWHTYCAHDFSEIVNTVIPTQLPREFQNYL